MVMTFIIKGSNQSQRIVAVTEGDHMLDLRDVCAVQDITTDALIGTHLVTDSPYRRAGRIVIHGDRRDLNRLYRWSTILHFTTELFPNYDPAHQLA